MLLNQLEALFPQIDQLTSEVPPVLVRAAVYARYGSQTFVGFVRGGQWSTVTFFGESTEMGPDVISL